MKPPELFIVGELEAPICGDKTCEVRENPEHYTSIALSSFVTESLQEAIKYLTPHSVNSPVAAVLTSRFHAILEADKSHK